MPHIKTIEVDEHQVQIRVFRTDHDEPRVSLFVAPYPLKTILSPELQIWLTLDAARELALALNVAGASGIGTSVDRVRAEYDRINAGHPAVVRSEEKTE